MLTLPPGASSTLVERLLSKIEFSRTPDGCDVWRGAYNIDGRRGGRVHRGRRPVIRLGGVGSPIVYVTPLLLALNGNGELAPHCPQTGVRLFACHTCVHGGRGEGGFYRCVTLGHLRWGTQEENEAMKRGYMYAVRAEDCVP